MSKKCDSAELYENYEAIVEKAIGLGIISPDDRCFYLDFMSSCGSDDNDDDPKLEPGSICDKCFNNHGEDTKEQENDTGELHGMAVTLSPSPSPPSTSRRRNGKIKDKKRSSISRRNKKSDGTCFVLFNLSTKFPKGVIKDNTSDNDRSCFVLYGRRHRVRRCRRSYENNRFATDDDGHSSKREEFSEVVLDEDDVTTRSRRDAKEIDDIWSDSNQQTVSPIDKTPSPVRDESYRPRRRCTQHVYPVRNKTCSKIMWDHVSPAVQFKPILPKHGDYRFTYSDTSLDVLYDNFSAEKSSKGTYGDSIFRRHAECCCCTCRSFQRKRFRRQKRFHSMPRHTCGRRATPKLNFTRQMPNHEHRRPGVSHGVSSHRDNYHKYTLGRDQVKKGEVTRTSDTRCYHTTNVGKVYGAPVYGNGFKSRHHYPKRPTVLTSVHHPRDRFSTDYGSQTFSISECGDVGPSALSSSYDDLATLVLDSRNFPDGCGHTRFTEEPVDYFSDESRPQSSSHDKSLEAATTGIDGDRKSDHRPCVVCGGDMDTEIVVSRNESARDSPISLGDGPEFRERDQLCSETSQKTKGCRSKGEKKSKGKKSFFRRFIPKLIKKRAA